MLDTVVNTFFTNYSIKSNDEESTGDYRTINLITYGKYKVWRSQLFSVDETILLHSIEKVLNQYFQYNDQELLNDITENIIIRTIAFYFKNKDKNFSEEIILDFLLLLERFSSQTYEGRRISLAISINKEDNGTSILFSDYFKYDFSKVLSNSVETVVEFDRDGKFISYVEANNKNKTLYSPYFYSSLANISSDKILLSLNYNGDILVFYDQQLVFSKRRGMWRYYQFDAIVNQVAFTNRSFSEDLRKEILLTCIDVSFAKTGGCIGYIYKDNTTKALRLVNQNDILYSESSTKTKVLNSVFKDKNFIDIPRMQRKEILGVDGALIINNIGKILCIGAIINLKESTEIGGGRTASAMELAKYGISFKISNDGPIVVAKNERKILIN